MKYASLDLIKMTAGEVVSLLKKNVVSPTELLDALEQRINEVDKEVNSLPTLCFTRARSEASKLMQKPIEDRGILAGLPIAIKDLAPVKDVRSTWGSLIYKDFVPNAQTVWSKMLKQKGLLFMQSQIHLNLGLELIRLMKYSEQH